MALDSLACGPGLYVAMNATFSESLSLRLEVDHGAGQPFADGHLPPV